MAWKPIEDLSGRPTDLASTELESLANIWLDRKADLKEKTSYKDFIAQFRRRWAIETGIIEGLYFLDRGITEVLIREGIRASLIPSKDLGGPKETVVSLLQDQESVLDGLFYFVANRRTLSTSYIKEVHSALTTHQDTVPAVDALGNRFEASLLRGEYKKTPNNPRRLDGTIHEYCPPEHVASEMDRLIEMHLEHVEISIPPEVESAWLHHRFTQIHPFQDGNGRIARTLASLVFLKEEWFPLLVERDDRSEYIRACEMADEGDLAPLVLFFCKVQKNSFIKALSISEDVMRAMDDRSSVIAAIGEKLKKRSLEETKEKQRVFSISKNLESKAYEYLTDVANELQKDLEPYSADFHATVVRNDPNSTHWFRGQVIEIAKKQDYFADLETYHSWVRLKIVDRRQVEFVISFHPIGTKFAGLMGCSGFIEYRDKEEDGSSRTEGPYKVSRELFQFSYHEKDESVRERFDKWLKETTVLALDEWRRQL